MKEKIWLVYYKLFYVPFSIPDFPFLSFKAPSVLSSGIMLRKPDLKLTWHISWALPASCMNKETSANARFFFHHLIPRIKSSCLVSGIKKHSLQSQRWKEKQGFWFFLFSATEYVYYQQNFADHPHKSIVVKCVC